MSTAKTASVPAQAHTGTVTRLERGPAARPGAGPAPAAQRGQ